MVSLACSRTSACTCRVMASWGARVASVSSMLAMSPTSVTVQISSAWRKCRQCALHWATSPTAGGHAQDFPYMGHSVSQT